MDYCSVALKIKKYIFTCRLLSGRIDACELVAKELPGQKRFAVDGNVLRLGSARNDDRLFGRPVVGVFGSGLGGLRVFRFLVD